MSLSVLPKISCLWSFVYIISFCMFSFPRLNLTHPLRSSLYSVYSKVTFRCSLGGGNAKLIIYIKFFIIVYYCSLVRCFDKTAVNLSANWECIRFQAHSDSHWQDSFSHRSLDWRPQFFRTYWLPASLDCLLQGSLHRRLMQLASSGEMRVLIRWKS